MRNITESFVEYLFEKKSRISETVRKKADECLSDYKAVAAAGAKKNKEKWKPVLEQLGTGNAVLFGYDKCVDSRMAALINGFNAHSLELDDGQRFAMIHLGASVISAILAAEAEFDISPERKQEGIIQGYEAACRLAAAIQPSHKQRGYHTSGTCGTVGAAVGTAFALGMDQKEMKRAVTAAAGSAAGLLEIQEQGSEMKPYNLGRAAMDGLSSAYMGLARFEPPEDMLGGERGFFCSFTDQIDEEKLLSQEDYFEIERIYVKPYASCRHSHSAVEAAIRLHAEVDCDQIKQIVVETYRLGVKGHDHTKIQGTASAKLSTPYAVAAALLYGRGDLTVFEPLDQRSIELAGKVIVQENKELTEISGEKRVAVVTVRLADGSSRSQRVDYAKGEPENPMRPEELHDKWNMLRGYEKG